MYISQIKYYVVMVKVLFKLSFSSTTVFEWVHFVFSYFSALQYIFNFVSYKTSEAYDIKAPV